MRNSWFARQLTPPLLWHCYSFFRSYLRLLLHARVLRRNKANKDSRRGQSVYVLGNGPSLNNFDLTTIFGEDVITMNYFYLHPNVADFKIVAHCIGEPFDSPTWVDPGDMVEKTGAQSYWFGLPAKQYCEQHYAGKALHYYLPGVAPAFNVLRRSDLSRPTLQYQSTAQMAIMVALHLGYKNVYLLGFDHDWLATRGYSPHFYKEDDDDPAIAKADFSVIPYLDMINITKNLFDVYTAIKKIATKQGANIVNLSQPSYLDIFPRKDRRHV